MADAYLFDLGRDKSSFLERLSLYPVDADGDMLPLYGVCDNPEQIFEHPVFAWAQASELKIVFGTHPVSREDQPAQGGWRWEKWGPYIGTREPRADYLYNEPEIDRVWVWCAYCKVE